MSFKAPSHPDQPGLPWEQMCKGSAGAEDPTGESVWHRISSCEMTAGTSWLLFTSGGCVCTELHNARIKAQGGFGGEVPLPCCLQLGPQNLCTF